MFSYSPALQDGLKVTTVVWVEIYNISDQVGILPGQTGFAQPSG